METLATRLNAVRERIEQAARQAGRAPEEITLIGVSKTHPAELVREALAAGLHDVGENRVQEAEQKIAELADVRSQLTWHLIGHLQRNKAKKAASLFDWVHSLDSLRLAETLSQQRGAVADTPLSVLLQVNVSGEESKDGFALAGWETQPDVFERFADEVAALLELPHLRVRGLMTIAPLTDDPTAARRTFHSTRLLRDRLAQCFANADWSVLSMGMSDDFADAIAEGATIVRVGRAIFGARPPIG